MAEPSTGPSKRSLREAEVRLQRELRQALALKIAEPHDGVVTAAMLLAAGLTRGQIDAQVARGAWARLGVHTVCVTGATLTGRAPWWRALWESGKHATLDGVTALLAAGLKGWDARHIEVTVPNNARIRPLDGVRHHQLRERTPDVDTGLRRTRPEVAAVRAAQWAVSDAEAATILAMTIQQRLTSTTKLLQRWQDVGYSARRSVLDDVIKDICSGAQSLGELDFARMCRQRHLPEPDRQVLRTGTRGRVYLDVFWEAEGVHVEIQGVHHYLAPAPIDDALRSNDLAIRGTAEISLQVPVLGLRIAPRAEALMNQVAQALVEGRQRRLVS